MINCYICGSWIKPNKEGVYKCPKCKAKWVINDGKVVRIYDNYKDYVEN